MNTSGMQTACCVAGVGIILEDESGRGVDQCIVVRVMLRKQALGERDNIDNGFAGRLVVTSGGHSEVVVEGGPNAGHFLEFRVWAQMYRQETLGG